MIQQSPSEERADTALKRAQRLADDRAKEGKLHIEGSIYEGMEACLVRNGRTIAHVVKYADALALAEICDKASLDICPACNGSGVGVADTTCSLCNGSGGVPLASQAAQPAEADGWVMVPRQLTEEMARAGAKGRQNSARASFEDGWKLALAATPKAPATDAGEVERAAERVIRALLGNAHRNWDADPIQETEREWARPIALAALATPPAPNDDLRAALEWIDYHKDDQDMNHVNFRIGAGSRARDALAALKENRRG